MIVERVNGSAGFSSGKIYYRILLLYATAAEL